MEGSDIGWIGFIILILFLIIGLPWILIAQNAQWQTTVMHTSKIKVSQVNVGYDWWTNSELTEVLGFDGKENLSFWNNVSQYFQPNHEYNVVYHADFKGFIPIHAWTLVSATEILPT